MSTLVVVLIVLALTTILALNIALTSRKDSSFPQNVEDDRGLPEGVVVYSDADGAGTPLYATRYPLLGKPDYVVRTPRGVHIPVDVKSGRAGRGPRHEDVLQLVVYLMILDDLYPRDPTPRWGELRYANATYAVTDDPALRDEVLTIVAAMTQIDAAFGHDDPSPPVGVARAAVCRTCAFKTVCEDAAPPQHADHTLSSRS